MLPIIIITVIFAYFIYAAHVLDLHRPAMEALCKPVAEWFGEAGNPTTAILWGMVGVLTLAAWLSDEHSFLGGLRGEITGMAFTVIVIDRLNTRRIEEQRKQEIFEQIESPVRDVAVESIRLIQKYGWLEEVVKLDKLQFVHLEGANLKYANLANANLREAHLEGAKLKGVNLKDANLFGANLAGASLTDANLQNTNLEKADLFGVDLSFSNLQYANLQGANLSVVNFQETILLGTNLHTPWWNDTILKGAKYSNSTIFPDGFNPEAAGAIKVED